MTPFILPDMSVELVRVQEKHYEFIRELRTREENARWFLQQVSITPAQQKAYMESHASNYRVCEVDGIPAGYVGVIDGDIRICTDSAFAGKGVGSFMLRAIMRDYPDATGQILKDNVASRRLFEKCGVPYKVI